MLNTHSNFGRTTTENSNSWTGITFGTTFNQMCRRINLALIINCIMYRVYTIDCSLYMRICVGLQSVGIITVFSKISYTLIVYSIKIDIIRMNTTLSG